MHWWHRSAAGARAYTVYAHVRPPYTRGQLYSCIATQPMVNNTTYEIRKMSPTLSGSRNSKGGNGISTHLSPNPLMMCHQRVCDEICHRSIAESRTPRTHMYMRVLN